MRPSCTPSGDGFGAPTPTKTQIDTSCFLRPVAPGLDSCYSNGSFVLFGPDNTASKRGVQQARASCSSLAASTRTSPRDALKTEANSCPLDMAAFYLGDGTVCGLAKPRKLSSKASRQAWTTEASSRTFPSASAPRAYFSFRSVEDRRAAPSATRKASSAAFAPSDFFCLTSDPTRPSPVPCHRPRSSPMLPRLMSDQLSRPQDAP